MRIKPNTLLHYASLHEGEEGDYGSMTLEGLYDSIRGGASVNYLSSVDEITDGAEQ